MTKRPFDEYRRSLEKALKRGDSTEHTHRPALKKMLESLYPGTTATNEPERRPGIGAVDMIVTRREGTVGFVETKDIDQPLNRWERTDQGKRYLRAWPSLILTDYLEFRWFRYGKRVRTERLGTASDDRIKIEPEGGAKVRSVLDEFFAFEAEPPATAKALATRLAGLAHPLREVIARVLKGEGKRGHLHEQMEAFRKTLIPDLDEDRFADMYAQTLAYGLFAARVECPEGKVFTRAGAAGLIPHTNPFLRKMFHEITGPDLDERIAPEVDYVAEVLNAANMEEVLKDFAHKTGREDPVVHFYETFLAAYDPKLRERRGVYYTPEPVVSYIVRSVDEILKKDFKRPLGLADDEVFILDPACGTGSFLHEVITLIHGRLHEVGMAGTWSDYVRNKLLNRVFGFELLMAPYAVAHLKLAMLLKDLGYDFKGHERIEVYLTNTLDEAIERSEYIFGRWIVDEANAAAEIKKEKPILVVLGNPPYSGESANASYKMVEVVVPGKPTRRRKELTWIGRLIEDYMKIGPRRIKERVLKWLHDDYVKFLRFGQWRIDRTGDGILAFVTNHSYLDNPTFRAMRWRLMQSFTDIRLLDLHGNSKKKERCPDGSKDENVFDVMQGVAIGLFTRAPGRRGPAKVRHANLWGVRKKKEKYLDSHDASSTKWARIEPKTPQNMFVPRDERRAEEYEAGWRVTDVMPVNSVGIVTARDALTIGWTPGDIWEKVREFAGLDAEEARRRFDLGPDRRDWKVRLAQEDIRTSGPRKDRIAPILYRPFDVRFTYYTATTRGFICMPRSEVMGNMLRGRNLALVTARTNKAPDKDHFLATRLMTEAKCAESTTQSCLMPVRLFPDGDARQRRLFEEEIWLPGKDGGIPNLSPKFVDELAGKLRLQFIPDGRGDLKKTFGPEDIFAYIYSIFHSPTYRKRYAEFLKTDFPRVPLTSDRALFRKLVKLGGELVGLHLMESPVLKEKPGPEFNVKGSNEVEKVRYEPKPKRVYINKTQHFQGVPPEVWDFHVGGYQVMHKWLKDRAKAKRRLTTDGVRHYKRIAVALGETIKLMQRIDKTVPRWPIK